MRKKNDLHFLLTWDSVQHGFVVTARALALLYEKKGIKIDQVQYLIAQDLSDDNRSGLDLFTASGQVYATRGNEPDQIALEIVEIREQLRRENALPEVKAKRLHIKGPTDYGTIYEALRKLLLEIEAKYRDGGFCIHVNVSPGTPQMHVVWLMLNSGGFFPAGTRLWATQWLPEQKVTILNEVEFKPKTYLGEIFEQKYQRKQQEASIHSPKEGGKYQLAQDRFKRFLVVPNAPVLVLGERGTGKSTMVKRIIEVSKIPFRELVCGTLSHDLIRAELFGYVKGAFTGADKNKEGLIDQVKNNGVLFLDEIQDLSRESQRLLLQVLQTGQYYPIGATEPRDAEFRIVCASNQPLAVLFGEGRLDADFFDRISRFLVELPPIRECQEDLGNFWESAWAGVSAFEAAPQPPPSEMIVTKIRNLPLPGNFRDLEKIAALLLIEKLEKKSDKEAVEIAIREYQRVESLKQSGALDHHSFFEKGMTLVQMQDSFRVHLWEWALSVYGSSSEAQKALGISAGTASNLRKVSASKSG